jgi:hypothetical protein
MIGQSDFFQILVSPNFSDGRVLFSHKFEKRMPIPRCVRKNAMKKIFSIVRLSPAVPKGTKEGNCAEKK